MAKLIVAKWSKVGHFSGRKLFNWFRKVASQKLWFNQVTTWSWITWWRQYSQLEYQVLNQLSIIPTFYEFFLRFFSKGIIRFDYFIGRYIVIRKCYKWVFESKTQNRRKATTILRSSLWSVSLLPFSSCTKQTPHYIVDPFLVIHSFITFPSSSLNLYFPPFIQSTFSLIIMEPFFKSIFLHYNFYCLINYSIESSCLDITKISTNLQTIKEKGNEWKLSIDFTQNLRRKLDCCWWMDEVLSRRWICRSKSEWRKEVFDCYCNTSTFQPKRNDHQTRCEHRSLKEG